MAINAGNKRFTGPYRYNGGYGPNYPIYGACFHNDGSPWYEGEIKVYRSGLGWPTVTVPENYGPVVQSNAPDLSFSDEHVVL